MDERREGQKLHDTTGDTSLSGDRQGGSGRPRRRCFRDDKGVENASIPLRKRGRMARFDCMTFSDFWSDENDHVGEKRNRNNCVASQMLCHKPMFLSCFLIERPG